ncbi:MAG: hypothetical protein AAGA56_22575 [Myxococcota bacterium]
MAKSAQDDESTIDVGALLEAVLDQPPPPDLSDRVMGRLALAETVTELARLFGLVPVDVAADIVGKDEDA